MLLECCRIELDGLGGVSGYEPRDGSCPSCRVDDAVVNWVCQLMPPNKIDSGRVVEHWDDLLAASGPPSTRGRCVLTKLQASLVETLARAVQE
jgi:hypothetical protein